MTTTEKNVRGLARARGYRLSKIRSKYLADRCYLIIDQNDEVVTSIEMNSVPTDLEDAEYWLSLQPTVERGRFMKFDTDDEG
jgi:hypothetical protein